VQSKEREAPTDENGIEPLHPPEHRASRVVIRVRVRIVADEALVRAGMTAQTGLDEAAGGHRRGRITSRQNAVRVVTVGALGDAFEAERRHLTVERVPVSPDLLDVARAALLNDVELKTRCVGAANGVCRMTGGARRRGAAGGAQAPGMDAQIVLARDPDVTPAAGPGDSHGVRAAGRVGLRQNVVRSMTPRTRWRHCQAEPPPPFLVNAVLKVRHGCFVTRDTRSRLQPLGMRELGRRCQVGMAVDACERCMRRFREHRGGGRSF